MWAFIDRCWAVREKNDDWEGRYRKGIIWERERDEERSKEICRLHGVELRLIFHRYIYYRHHNIITYYTMFLLLFLSLFSLRLFFNFSRSIKKNNYICECEKNGYELYAKRCGRRSFFSYNKNRARVSESAREKKDTYCAKAFVLTHYIFSHSLNVLWASSWWWFTKNKRTENSFIAFTFVPFALIPFLKCRLFSFVSLFFCFFTHKFP